VPLLPDAEVTLEANPGTFERQKFADFHAAGVNRLSLGIQSFDPAQLQALGRVHDANEARRAAEAALMIFGNVNFDLMYGLPRQTVQEASTDLAAALAFAPPHLSFYHLTLEPNTLFHRYPPPLPDDDTAADIEDAVHATLDGAGYQHYETSAYARPGRQCAHNANYWRFGDYLGIGAGAHSKLSFADRIVRQLRWKQPKQYVDAVALGRPLQEEVDVTRGDVGFEFMLNALRLTAGVPTALFAERTGYPLSLVANGLYAATRKGLLESDPASLRPTALGRRFLNDLQSLFLTAPSKGRNLTGAAPLVRRPAPGIER
jgi:oxygen-independent coproporphyrinogen-3 oxidase